MKASKVREPGFYWLSHDLNDWGAGESLPAKWNIVQVDQAVHFGREQLVLWTIGEDEGVGLDDLPDYVSMIGPIKPPK